MDNEAACHASAGGSGRVGLGGAGETLRVISGAGEAVRVMSVLTGGGGRGLPLGGVGLCAGFSALPLTVGAALLS